MALDLIQKKLERYGQTWKSGALTHRTFEAQEEAEIFEAFSRFCAQQEQWFERHNWFGHFTGSALVCSLDMQKVLLTHHRKLNMWLQLGGHADGNADLHAVARQEVSEESGLSRFHFLKYESLFSDLEPSDVPLPFDLDYHTIPARKNEPQHIHFDVRFLVMADEKLSPAVSEESHDVRWLHLDEARSLTNERSMHRQFDKLEALRKQLKDRICYPAYSSSDSSPHT